MFKKKQRMGFIIFFIILSFLVIYIFSINKDCSKIKLNVNEKEMLNISDLTIDDIKYGDNIKTVEQKYGKPKKIKEISNLLQKKYIYNGLIFIFQNKNNDYTLVGMKVTSKDYYISRKIKVGMSAKKVMNRFFVDKKTGNYMYGNYKYNSLNDSSIIDEVYFGYRQKKYIYYVNKDSYNKINNSIMKRNMMNLKFNIRNNRVISIEWSYGLNKIETESVKLNSALTKTK